MIRMDSLISANLVSDLESQNNERVAYAFIMSAYVTNTSTSVHLEDHMRAGHLQDLDGSLQKRYCAFEFCITEGGMGLSQEPLG